MRWPRAARSAWSSATVRAGADPTVISSGDVRHDARRCADHERVPGAEGTAERPAGAAALDADRAVGADLVGERSAGAASVVDAASRSSPDPGRDAAQRLDVGAAVAHRAAPCRGWPGTAGRTPGAGGSGGRGRRR